MKILLLDIETSPLKALVWQLKQKYISPDHIVDSGGILCWSAKWYGEKDVMFFSTRNGVKKMLKKMWDLLDEADIVIHYNGLSFDIPMLSREFLLHKMLPPSPYKHIDLLMTFRRTFSFPSNKLDYVCKRLELGGKVGNEEGMKLWMDCEKGDRKAWANMELYNKNDVLLLEKLYNRVKPYIDNHPKVTSEKGTCPSCGSSKLQYRGWNINKVSRTRKIQCRECGSWHAGSRESL